MSSYRGRAVSDNPAGRFESRQQSAFDDGWGEDDEGRRGPATRAIQEACRSIITRNDSPDVPFDRSINPYRGCEHGCIYCFARPSHAYVGLSAGLDFETIIHAKMDAAQRLREALARPSYRCAPIALGANTDPYQPLEQRLGITRSLLEVLAEHRHPVVVVTKSDRVLADLDLLSTMAADGTAQVLVSITTLDGVLARRMEPRAPAPSRRLAALAALAAAGVPCGVLASPMIPGLNDHELENVVVAAAEAGARWAGTILVRLPHELGDLLAGWLQEHYPQRRRRVLKLIASCRGGRLNDSRFGDRMRGRGPYAAALHQRFRGVLRRLGLEDGPPPLEVGRFSPPRRGQLSLF